MNTKKIVLGGIVLILVAGIVFGVIWWMRRPQVVKFSDGSKLTLLAVEYGKRHVPPPTKTPTPGGARGRRYGPFTTPNDTLVLWLRQECDTSEWHNFQYYVYDKDGTACVESGGSYGGNGQPSNQVISVQISAFPRRQGKFYVRVQENGNGFNETAEKKFTIANPVKNTFTDWKAESLPATKDDEDVSVTLTKLTTSVDTGSTRGDTDPDDAMNKGVQATLHVERGGRPIDNWQPVSVTTSDATGNSIGAGINRNDWQNGDGTIIYQWGLWSDEPAWKIRLEMSQQSDFADYEMWKVEKVPFQPGRQQDFWNFNPRNATTNAPFAETDLNGIHLKIFPAKQFTDAGQNSNPQGGLTIQANPQVSGGMRMEVNLTDDQGGKVDYWNNGTWSNGGSTTYRYSLRDTYGLTNLNVSITLHKSRYVEFTVKPQKAPAPAQQ